ncbi:adenosylhomocysteinase [Agromyces soli]|uniref:Adenosylhomocysteinase n=1 Tax=Agromyces soli TaxID=659012 RepID=A0ABY4ASD3_9MICO|nr:adenosylhomocysteinase [Agromyces soli]UOE26072.1 adenosylhomocysteinase [Agromyces soli]
MTDLHLPPSGFPALDWAARSMPVLAATMREHAEAFAGRHVGICLHTEPKTGVLVQWLLRVGARVTITGNLGTTVPETAAALAELGATVVGERTDDPAEHSRNVARVVAAEPELLLDNGGEMIELVLRGGPRAAGFLGATEETTTGGRRLRELEVEADFPVIVINDSRLKLLVENEYGVGQSIVQGFMNATNAMLPGIRATVIGYGPCGKGVADTLQRLGARVSVADADPYRALEAIMHGHRVGPLAELLPGSDALFLATGHPDVVPAEAFPLLPDGLIIAGVGHEPYELDLAALAEAAVEQRSLSVPGGDASARSLYRMPDGREIVVLHGTRMINLVAASGNPIQAMDLGLSLQAASLAAIATGRAPFTGPHAVPADVDRALATRLVETWR